MSNSTLLHESSPAKLVKEDDGTYRIVLITPGVGSTGDYSEEVLRAYGAETWPAGSHSYVDHPTKNEPSRSPKNLIGVLTEDAHYEDGEGLVSHLKPMPHWEAFVEAVAPYTGLSIFARGTGRKEVRDGREVTVVESFEPNIQNTVDLVSYAGRGGHFAETAEALYESAIEQSTHVETSAGSEKKDKEDMTTLEEVATQLATLSGKFDTFLSEQESARKNAADKDAEAVEAAKAVKDAIAATRAVESAEIPKSVKDSLLEDIEGGNYDVSAKIESAKTLREEILAEAQVELLGRSNSVDDGDYSVAGWSK